MHMTWPQVVAIVCSAFSSGSKQTGHDALFGGGLVGVWVAISLVGSIGAGGSGCGASGSAFRGVGAKSGSISGISFRIIMSRRCLKRSARQWRPAFLFGHSCFRPIARVALFLSAAFVISMS